MSCRLCSPDRPALGDYNIEMAVLSCMLQAPDTQIDAAMQLLKADDFASSSTGLLFDMIIRRHTDGELVDTTSLMSHIFDKQMQNQITPVFLSECLTAASNPSHTAHYAQSVLEFSKRRQMVRIGSDLVAAAMEGGNEGWEEGAVEVLRRADSALMGKQGDEIVKIQDVAAQYSDAFEKDVTQGIDPPTTTGIAGLDKLLDGGIRREYVLIGGLQGSGKSLLAMQMAGEMAKAGKKGLIIGYDMTPIQVFMRDLAREAKVPLNQIMGRTPIEGGFSFQSVARGVSRLHGWSVWYTNSPYMTFDTAAAHARTLHRQFGLDFVLVDFIQKIPLKKQGKERTDEALVSLSRRIWALQRELGCTLIAPVQLNDDGMIREARGLLDDPELFIRIEMETTEQDGEITAGDDGWFRILKNRFGPKDKKIPVFRNGQFQQFEDREYSPQPQKQTTRTRKTW